MNKLWRVNDEMCDETAEHLNLDALRYLSGEMGEDGMRAFESLLSEGGAACDALADMVLLERTLLATRGAGPASLVSRRVSPVLSRRSLWATGVCAATLMAAACVVWLSPPGRDASGFSANDLSAAELSVVANVWSDLGEETATSEDREEVDLLADSSTTDVPDWMVAAVLAVDAAKSESVEANDEEQL